MPISSAVVPRIILRNTLAGIVNVINILDPELIIIGGDVAKTGKDLLDPINAAVSEGFKIVPALENGSDLATISVPIYQ